MQRWSRAAILCISALLSCNDGPTGPGAALPIDLTESWVTVSPAALGADTARITRALAAARDNSRLLSLLLVKDGRLVVEQYFNGNDAGSLNDVRSVTKSVVSALAGLALHRGALQSLDQSIGDFLHPEIIALDAARQAITVRHLLTMTSGFAWDESGGLGSYIDWIFSNDHIGHLIRQPLATTPGASFRYNSAAVHLLGVVLEQATGMPLEAFADQYLFRPIGIRTSQWEPLTGGYVNGGAGVDLRPRDLARFGQLFLQQGRSGDRQVLPERWVAESIVPRFAWRTTAEGVADGVTYGYLWWIVTGEPEPAYMAWGFGGQFIYVVPDLQVVAVTTTEWRQLTDANRFEQSALGLIVDELVPAFRGR